MSKKTALFLICFFIVYVIFALGLSACGGQPLPPEYQNLNPPAQTYGDVIVHNDKQSALHRIVDHEAGVVCYFLNFTGPVTCLPIGETSLASKK